MPELNKGIYEFIAPESYSTKKYNRILLALCLELPTSQQEYQIFS